MPTYTSFRLPLRTLRRGARGPDVAALQSFLIGEKAMRGGTIDGNFGSMTEVAVMDWQRYKRLKADGVVGAQTWVALIQAGMHVVADDAGTAADYPPEPDHLRILPSNAACHQRWGKIEYRPDNNTTDRDAIVITNDFEEKFIVSVQCPVFGRKLRFHKEVAPHYVAAMEEIKAAGHAPLLLSFDGSFVPRFQRGSKTALSRHSWGTAFDVNCDYNSLGKRPAGPGKPGYLWPIVPILNKHGFYWGGHWGMPRTDGMHFEHTGQ